MSNASSPTRESKDLGNGFIDHGVATPLSNHRGIVATVDGKGRSVLLVWLFDGTGGYAILVIDADTGEAQQIPMPFPSGGDCPYSSILSSRNRFYTHFGSHFVEFDPASRTFTACHKTEPQMAMGMTEDDRGRIWSVTYPKSGVVCFDPATGKLKDYGHVHAENWHQYQRSVAADDTGWVYFAVGNTASQIISFNPETGVATPVLPESERAIGTAVVYRDRNGKVYGQSLSGRQDGWYELYRGQAKKIGLLTTKNEKPIITSSQGLFHDRFPDGRQAVTCDLVEGIVAVKDASGTVTQRHFSYTSDGAHIMGVAAAPDGTICGGTSFPMRFFCFNPRTNTWFNHAAYGQCNTVASQGDKFFVGGYIYGYLLEWDPARPWVKTEKGNPGSNPRFLTECEPKINRPHKLLAHPDGKTLVLAGTPGYGHTGGALLFWDRETETATLIDHTQILTNHSTTSLVALPGGKLLGGSTTDPGTGGERKVSLAELYVMDIATKKIEWHAGLLPGVQSYHDLILAKNGMVYGIGDGNRFFTFDPGTKQIVHEENSEERFGWIGYQQGPRKLLATPGGEIYVLFQKALARINLATHALEVVVKTPVHAQFGGDILAGRLYFASGSHVYSYALPGQH